MPLRYHYFGGLLELNYYTLNLTRQQRFETKNSMIRVAEWHQGLPFKAEIKDYLGIFISKGADSFPPWKGYTVPFSGRLMWPVLLSFLEGTCVQFTWWSHLKNVSPQDIQGIIGVFSLILTLEYVRLCLLYVFSFANLTWANISYV